MDLVSQVPYARRLHQIDSVDCGVPEARKYLTSGWSYDEALENGTRCVWGVGSFSEIQFFLADGRPDQIEIVCQGIGSTTNPATSMSVIVNGDFSDRLMVAAGGFRTYAVHCEQSQFRRGMNTVRFEYGGGEHPKNRPPGNNQGRPIAVLFDRVDLVGVRGGHAPDWDSSGDHGRIRLPSGSSLRLHLNLPRTAALWMADVRSTHTSAKAKLRVRVRDDQNETLLSKEVPVGSGAVGLSLGLPRNGVFELELTPSETRGRPAAGLELVDPVILGALAAQHHQPQPAVLEPGEVQRPSILVYVVDCLRADRLNSRREKMAVSPRMDAFAASAVAFERARAHSSWTRSSVVSLLSGLPPEVHGVHGDEETVPDEVTLVPEILQNAGYRTASVITNGMVSGKFGFDRGYDLFVRLTEQHAKNPEIHQLSDRLNEVFLAWLDDALDNGPFFAYLHATDPHAPYLPRSPYRRLLAPNATFDWGRHVFVEQLTQRRIPAGETHVRSLTALYEAEVAFNDAHFGALMDALRK
jgi:hypothetical protein